MIISIIGVDPDPAELGFIWVRDSGFRCTKFSTETAEKRHEEQTEGLLKDVLKSIW